MECEAIARLLGNYWNMECDVTVGIWDNCRKPKENKLHTLRKTRHKNNWRRNRETGKGGIQKEGKNKRH